MADVNESRRLLEELGVPPKQQAEMCAYTLLALGKISPKQKWKDAENPWIRIHDIREFISAAFGKDYAENTRETIRKDCLKPFRDENWLYFIEAVTSVGPMTPRRVQELQEISYDSEAGKIFVTAFPDFSTFKKFSSDLAWETEVWIAEMPEHMIHLNGDRFLGPRN